MTTTYLLDDIAQTYLPANTPFVFGSNLYASLLPDFSPDTSSVVNEYGGMKGHHTMGMDNSGLPAISTPRIQVLCRGDKDDYLTPRENAYIIWKALLSIANLTINGTLYERIESIQSEPFFLERDDTRRVFFVCNYQVYRSVTD